MPPNGNEPRPTVSSTQDLRQLLIDTINDVREGNIDARSASAIGGLAGKILQSAKLDLDCARLQISLGERPVQPVAPQKLIQQHGQPESESAAPALPGPKPNHETRPF